MGVHALFRRGCPMISPANQIFTVRETYGRVLRTENRLIAHSEETGWRSLYAAIVEEAPFHATEPALRHPSLIYHLCRPTAVMRKIEGAPPESAHQPPPYFGDPGRGAHRI